MAIPVRTTIVCPSCGASDDVVISDTSAGPGPSQAIGPTPVYTLLPHPRWSQTARDGVTWIGCVTCGAADFTTLAGLATRDPRRTSS